MERENFERLYDEHAQPLFGFLVYRTGDRALAEDVLGEAFERVLRGRRLFDRRRGGEKTWLYTIALNVLRDHMRRVDAESRALERVEAAGGEAAPETERVEDRDRLQRALAALTAEEREAVALRYGADLSIPEVAEALGEKLTTVDGRLRRALRKLREELGE
jgi:RNA polymerase sigma factor (sigma-70 family)